MFAMSQAETIFTIPRKVLPITRATAIFNTRRDNMSKATQTAPEWLLTTVKAHQGERATIRQVADAIQVHPTTVRRLIGDGKLEEVRVGNRRFVSRASIERFLGAEAE